MLAQAPYDLVRRRELVPRLDLSDHHRVALDEPELARPARIGPLAGVLLQPRDTLDHARGSPRVRPSACRT